ncbi:hypothetical protein C2S53_008507 [Perilla frutescens var. hirtella]|uniref:U-box domain-containing protein n=1 Tax=Perilla frutescens var. hirtella TaxID=608512 RepID=A0AAD4PEL3_PERFH|nr:hypothetical protein C2S53_008507 [Perilla frutescens var. hirtella]
MSSLWRRRRRGRGHGAGKKDAPEGINSATELTIPTHFRCPISLDLMKDPVSLATGITYDREHIDKWIEAGHATCPVTNQALRNLDQIPNHALRKMIQDWCVDNKSYGVERIPTPRVPITPYDVSDFCSRMSAATRARDGDKCQELVAKVKNSARESERNKRCLVNSGIGAALAETFEAFAGFSVEKHATLLKEIMCVLTWSCFTLGEEGVARLRSSVSLRCMAWFINGEDLSSRRNAVFLLKELVVSGVVLEGIIMEKVDQGIEETLLGMVKVPICPRATQACLVLIHHMMTMQSSSSLRFVEMGLVALVLDILVDGNTNKSTCEKALGVLDDACSLEGGRQSACKNALTIPILVKKILRVSEMATEYSISILWKLCLGGNEEAPIEALQFGAFQKLLVLLQVGCGEPTKEKVTELLKFLNVYRNKVDCFQSSMPLKCVKNPI